MSTFPFVFYHFIVNNVPDLGGLGWVFALLNIHFKHSLCKQTPQTVEHTFSGKSFIGKI